MNDPCEGCIADKMYSFDCEHKPWNANCPCTICLIKVMCQITCDEFKTFSDNCEDIKTTVIGRKEHI
jgi:hypothetical protein